jgi:hypothetical protein
LPPLEGTISFLIYSQFETSFLHLLDELDWSTILDISASSDIADAEKKVANLKLSLERTEKQIRVLTDKMLELDTPAAALNKLLLELEEKSATEKTAFENAEREFIEAKARHNHFLDRSLVFSTLVKAKDIETRVRLREEIRRKVSRIDFDFDATFNGSLAVFHQRDGAGRFVDIAPEQFWECQGPVIRVRFVNGAERLIILNGDKAILLWTA